MPAADLPFGLPEVDYSEYSNRQLIAVPLVVLLVALLIISGVWLTTGAPVNLGVEFTGGTEMRVAVSGDNAQQQIQQAFDPAPSAIQPVAGEETYILTFGEGVDSGALETQAEDAGFTVRSIDATSASFGAEAQIQALGGVVVAFVGMSVLVFAMFRTFVPSIAVVLSAFSDIVVPVALMNVLGIKLTLGSVAALLMIIGYSVDSDILLNNHVLRRQGGFYESAYRAMETGITMTLTSIAAMVVMTVVATAFGIGLLSSIGLILVFGLTTDLLNTYMLNMSLLRWWKFEGVNR
ncbi:protein translocase subunit SecF [Halolamina salifodinae]|uniref:Protein-export membrane protein SecF n=2 Tax=Halolamina salifodinae TaxID=1202767 RepID=A0A8T4GVZ8_9EURY|nr:protein translocase subunit SecF [Halolamina salifodinae]MBP1985864.1 preprotein translocase subunit SecF [Halolamina salifodinae]